MDDIPSGIAYFWHVDSYAFEIILYLTEILTLTNAFCFCKAWCFSIFMNVLVRWLTFTQPIL